MDTYEGQTRYSGFKKQQWGSICSAHINYNKECPRCNAGCYRNIILGRISHYVYVICPWIWCKYMNRKNSSARKRLEEIFPNLKT